MHVCAVCTHGDEHESPQNNPSYALMRTKQSDKGMAIKRRMQPCKPRMAGHITPTGKGAEQEAGAAVESTVRKPMRGRCPHARIDATHMLYVHGLAHIDVVCPRASPVYASVCHVMRAVASSHSTAARSLHVACRMAVVDAARYDR